MNLVHKKILASLAIHGSILAMDELKKHYDELLKSYREIFVTVLGAVQAELISKNPDEILNYLEIDLENNIQHQRDLIVERRNHCNCGICGACCRLAISEFSYNELQEKSKNGDKFATQFIQTFLPYEKEPEELFPDYIKLIKDSGEKVYYYHCLKIGEDNKCSDYENRPQICRDYPDNPLQLLHPTCSFERWHSQIEKLVLTIKAMSEIKNHVIRELREKKKCL